MSGLTSTCATTLPAPLDDLRRITARGTVLAAFERSAYLDLNNRIVALASAHLPAGPLVIAVRDFEPLRALRAPTLVTLRDGRLHVGSTTVDLDGARTWDPSLAADGDAMLGPAPAARDAAMNELLAGAPAESIVNLLAPKRPASAHPTHTALLKALDRGLGAIADVLSGRCPFDAAAEIIGGDIAGRGPGLTPSGDDLLIGVLHALTVWPRLAGAANAPAVRTVIVNAARPRTTRISGAYLDAAGHGWAAEPWHALVRSFREPPASTRAAVRRLLCIGETSGADALTGFCWAWCRLAS